MILDHHPAIEALATENGGYVFRDESILGTRLQLILVAHHFAAAHAAAMAVRAEIDRLNGILDSRRPDSELFVLNRSRVHGASPELFAVIQAAEQWRTATGGAFSGRLGRVLDKWRGAVSFPPVRSELADLARRIGDAHVGLDIATRTIARPGIVEFALDALAKGWIVDRAFATACSAPGVTGALVDIGGDVRCGGQPPGPEGWSVGIPDPTMVADNAPLVATAHVSDHAVATSGRGPRDRVIGGVTYSPTVSPFDGWPIEHHLSATTIASTAADADALATALLVLPEGRAVALAEAHGAVARIARANNRPLWTRVADSTSSGRFTAIESRQSAASNAAAGDWKDGWQALATFTAPRRQLIRDPDFRSPYMAMWITDPDNRPIRTLLLVGKRDDWQHDNFIWWSINRSNTERLVATRSMSTSGAGVYNVFWDGVDDRGDVVPAGTYVLHVETSRERGKHTYRSLTLDFSAASRFVNELPPTEEGGGLRVAFDHY